MSVSSEMNHRVTQYMVLQWVWRLLRKKNKKEATKQIYSKMTLLSHGNNVDFEELTKELAE